MSANPKVIRLADYYNAIMTPRGFSLAPHHYPIVDILEDDRIENALFLLPAGAGKSNLLDIAYPTWALGRDPALAILSVSAGERLPQTFLLSAMQIIRDDPAFRREFPRVLPDPGAGWSLERGMFVTGHLPGDENPSYFCAGLGSKALTGLHARIMILDDLHDEENSRTPEGRAEVVNRYYRTLMGRADPRGCRRVAVGRWWAEDDLYQEWRRSGDWVVMELPATRKGGSRRLWYDAFVPKGLTCVLTENQPPEPVQDPDSNYVHYRVYYAAVDPLGAGFYWPASATARKNYEATKRRRPRIAAVNMDGDMTGGGEGIFAESDFRRYAPPPGLEQGIQSPYVRAWASSLKGLIEEAWDTALGQAQSSSLTVALTGMFVPCRSWHCGEDAALVGACDFHYDVYLLDLMARSLDFRGLAMALRTRHSLWLPRRVLVEEKQSGVSLLQTFKGTHIPVHGQKVEQGKVERAVNPVIAQDSGLPVPGGAASVQGWAKMGRILVPAGASWLSGSHGDAARGFIPTVAGFTGGVKASDEFDALVHLVTRAILLSRKTAYVPGMQTPSPESSLDSPAPPDVPDRAASDRAMLSAFGLVAAQAADPALSQDPFEGFCGSCRSFAVEDNAERCRRHARPASTFGGCADWTRR